MTRYTFFFAPALLLLAMPATAQETSPVKVGSDLVVIGKPCPGSSVECADQQLKAAAEKAQQQASGSFSAVPNTSSAPSGIGLVTPAGAKLRPDWPGNQPPPNPR